MIQDFKMATLKNRNKPSALLSAQPIEKKKKSIKVTSQLTLRQREDPKLSNWAQCNHVSFMRL